MQKLFAPLFLFLFLGLVTPNAVLAFEGKMVMTVTNGQKTDNINMTVKDKMLMIEAPSMKGSRVIINTASGETNVIMDGEGQKMAIKLNINSLKKVGGLSAFMGNTNTPGKQPTVKATTETKTINGYKCTKYLVTDDDITGEYWITKDITLNITSLFGMDNAEFANGMVIKGSGKNNKTGETFAFDVKPTAQTIADTTFKVPAGYQQMDMTQVFEQMAQSQDPNAMKKMFEGMQKPKK
ncbi:MAG: DUF4412 domain-containing protein [Chitinophagales bacterium]|nr:DUF4412 domain-containing protein [Chitinophagales bacterium]